MVFKQYEPKFQPRFTNILLLTKFGNTCLRSEASFGNSKERFKESEKIPRFGMVPVTCKKDYL